MTSSFDDLQKCVEDRIWYRSRGAFTFLVDAPLTFGHSQLVIKTHKSTEEERSLATALAHATQCIGVIRAKLPNPRGKVWQTLATYTGTSGHYLKTLILKVSAAEKEDVYKVHLVPYFMSHLKATNKLFQATHGKNTAGGLLHWIGQREVLVDYDMRDGRKNELVKRRISSFDLPGLASVLGGTSSPTA